MRSEISNETFRANKIYSAYHPDITKWWVRSGVLSVIVNASAPDDGVIAYDTPDTCVISDSGVFRNCNRRVLFPILQANWDCLAPLEWCYIKELQKIDRC